MCSGCSRSTVFHAVYIYTQRRSSSLEWDGLNSQTELEELQWDRKDLPLGVGELGWHSRTCLHKFPNIPGAYNHGGMHYIFVSGGPQLFLNQFSIVSGQEMNNT